MTPGIKTTEFWAFLGGLGTVFSGFVQTKCNFSESDILAVAIMVSAYIGGRTWLKAKTVNK